VTGGGGQAQGAAAAAELELVTNSFNTLISKLIHQLLIKRLNRN
jgi:hypothetical protein